MEHYLTYSLTKFVIALSIFFVFTVTVFSQGSAINEEYEDRCDGYKYIYDKGGVWDCGDINSSNNEVIGESVKTFICPDAALELVRVKDGVVYCFDVRVKDTDKCSIPSYASSVNPEFSKKYSLPYCTFQIKSSYGNFSEEMLLYIDEIITEELISKGQLPILEGELNPLLAKNTVEKEEIRLCNLWCKIKQIPAKLLTFIRAII